jgi:hypothetical protein
MVVMANIEQQLKRVARESELSIKALSDQACVPYSAVHGFITAERQISIGNAAKLARVLGLELRPVARRRRLRGRLTTKR